jgi:hypothetical protein
MVYPAQAARSFFKIEGMLKMKGMLSRAKASLSFPIELRFRIFIARDIGA